MSFQNKTSKYFSSLVNIMTLVFGLIPTLRFIFVRCFHLWHWIEWLYWSSHRDISNTRNLACLALFTFMSFTFSQQPVNPSKILLTSGWKYVSLDQCGWQPNPDFQWVEVIVSIAARDPCKQQLKTQQFLPKLNIVKIVAHTITVKNSSQKLWNSYERLLLCIAQGFLCIFRISVCVRESESLKP